MRVVRNDLDRFHLAADAINRLPKFGYLAGYVQQALHNKLAKHEAYIREHGEDMPDVKDRRWLPVDPTRTGA